MSRPGRPESEKIKAAEAYIKGDQVETLMKRHKVSRAGIYQWINWYKAMKADEASKEDKTPAQLAKMEHLDLRVELLRCQEQLQKTQQALVRLMVETGKV